ncbi:acetylcholine receptor subunit beta-like [Physella acuta]|uniref:acetylcholine receptor subunit beta-like n=1 Tax=Physella acuta TaxID=109671 RepID=UPI0027DB20FB|nr:acetylcholine receptor subunit beta-like [Physella acuta]
MYLGSDEDYVWVLSTGQITWEPIVNLEVSCKVTITEPGIDLSYMMTNGQFWITPGGTKKTIVANDDSNYSNCHFKLILSRRPACIVMTVLVPVTLLSLLGNVAFLMGPDEPEKLSISITVMLSFTVFMGVISDTLPETSETLPLLVFHLTSLLLLAFFGVIGNGIIFLVQRRHNILSTHQLINSESDLPSKEDEKLKKLNESVRDTKETSKTMATLTGKESQKGLCAPLL